MLKVFGHASAVSRAATRCLRSAQVVTVASVIAARCAEAGSGATKSGQLASAISQARLESGRHFAVNRGVTGAA